MQFKRTQPEQKKKDESLEHVFDDAGHVNVHHVVFPVDASRIKVKNIRLCRFALPRCYPELLCVLVVKPVDGR